jgi:hypothetical protein
MMRLLLACVTTMLWVVPAWAAPSWSFVLTVPAKPGEPVQATWTLTGFGGPLRLCADREGVAEYVQHLQQGNQPLAKAKDDPDCWTAQAPAKGPLVLTYQHDLNGLASGSRDPDGAVSIGGGYIFTDEAVLLRPDPLPDEAEINIEFRLPPGWDVATPWERLPGEGMRFRTNASQFDCGSYVAIGPLQRLGDVPVRGGAFELVRLGSAGKVTADELRTWVRQAGTNVANFYEGLPSPRVEVLLAEVPCSDRAGVFGSALREMHPSVVLFFCGDAPAAAFGTDWMPTHEFFHLGNPVLDRRVPWFTEGSATYYQDVLRARSGQHTPGEMWGDLYDGFRRFCDPEDGVSLGDESRQLRRRHRYQRLYWGAACLFFRVDVAIRIRSAGRRSLDDVLREVRRSSLVDTPDEAGLIEALDDAAGTPIASEQLKTTKPLALDGLYRQLGLEPTGPDSVKLQDEAPLAGLRKQIF